MPGHEHAGRPDGAEPDRAELEGAGPAEADSESGNKGLMYGIIGGMMVGVIIYILTDQVFWMAVGPSLGLAIGVALDSKKG